MTGALSGGVLWAPVDATKKGAIPDSLIAIRAETVDGLANLGL
jgi:hypothetical protein